MPAKKTQHPWLPNLLLTLPFLAFYAFNLTHHQLWFDEINAWAIAAAAHSPRELLSLIHFEGHPWLWYFLLYLPSRFTHDPAAMKWVEGLFGASILLVLGLLSPFTRVQKVLLFLSYYVVFEYTVLSRMYSVMFLIALLYTVRRTRKPASVVGNLALLGLLANTDATGILLSFALLTEYAFTLYTHPPHPTLSTAAKAALAYLALLAVSVETALPAKNISHLAPVQFGFEALHLHRLTQSFGNLVVSPWWPISHELPHRFWGTDIMEFKPLLLLAPVILFAFAHTFRRSPNLLLLLGTTLALGMLFADLVYIGSPRHWGIVVLAFLIALWLQNSERYQTGAPDYRLWSPAAYALIALSVLAGVTATASSYTHPFSEQQAAANWVRLNEPESAPIAGDWVSLAELSEELQRPMFYMECNCFATFRKFADDRDQFPDAQLPPHLTQAMQSLKTHQLLLARFRPLTPEDQTRLTQSHLQSTPAATFPKADDRHSSFYLYRIIQTP